MGKERAIELLKETIDYVIRGGVNANCVHSEEDLINLLFAIGFTEEELIEDLGYPEDLIDSANSLLN